MPPSSHVGVVGSVATPPFGGPTFSLLHMLVRFPNKCSRHELRQVPMRVWKGTQNRLEIPLHFSHGSLWLTTPTNKNSILMRKSFRAVKKICSKDSERTKRTNFCPNGKKPCYTTMSAASPPSKCFKYVHSTVMYT